MKRYLFALALALPIFATITAVLISRSGAPRPVRPDGGGAPGAASVPSGGEEETGDGLMAPASTGESVEESVEARGETEGSASTEVEEPATESLPLRRGAAVLTFEVVDGSQGPVPGLTVALLTARRRAEQVTGRDGTARFAGIDGGTYTYRLSGELSGIAIPELTSAREVTLGAEEEKRIRLQVASYDLSISGRVIDRAGNPLPGVPIFAREQIVDVTENRVIRASQDSLRAESGPDGSYEITGLGEGDYVLSVERVEGYPTVRKVFRAGTRTADLVLDPSREVVLYGAVTSRDRVPLPDAHVVPGGQVSRTVRTGKDGTYSLRLEVTEGQSVYVLAVRAEGYRETRTNVRAEDFGTEESWQVDIVLDPLGEGAPVEGVLLDATRAPVSGESVYLQSHALNARHQASTDAEGRFSFGEVQVGADYRLVVFPRPGAKGRWFRDYSRAPISVPAEGLQLEVVLEPVELGTLRGVMVDATGAPVPRFSLSLRSMSALGSTITVTGDAAGRFEADDVPEGDLILETRSLPRLRVQGISLGAGEEKDVSLVLDWGQGTLEGSVLDAGGAPLPGAQVSLHWTLERPDLEGSSYRATVTDAQGRFAFSELGPGEHRITAEAAGHLPMQGTHDVGSGAPAPVFRLQAAAKAPR